MALTVNTNVSALNAQRHLQSSGLALDKASQRLSSGRRINSSADDAAGLSISNRMTSQARGLQQAIRNANDGISLIQTADGTLEQSANLLQRIRELSIQSANGIYTDADRATLDAEVAQLISELDRVGKETNFNGRSILDGSSKKIDLQVGSESNQTITLELPKVDAKSLGMNTSSGDVVSSNLNLGSTGTLSSAISDGDVLINGQSIGDFTTSDTLGDLIDKINDDIIGIGAEARVVIEADSVGDGILEDGNQVNLSGYLLNGSNFSINIENTASLEDLAKAINEKTEGLVNASIGNDGALIIIGENLSTLSISDDTSGQATGINQGSVGGSSDEQAVVNALQDYWIREGEDLIDTYFGLTGTGVDLTLNLYTDSGSSTLASVSWSHVPAFADFGTDLQLNVNMYYFNDATLPNGGNSPVYTDRVIAHEMVHAVMTVRMDMEQLPGWFTEGVPEFIHGADERVVGDIYTGGAVDAAKVAALSLYTANGSPPDSAGYTSGYLAVRMLHDNILAETGNVAGIESLLGTLEGQGLATDLDAAITALGINWGTGNGLAEFITHFDDQKDEYIAGTYNGPGGAGTTSSLDLSNTDTGSVAGSDVGGGTALTAESVLPNTVNAGPANFNLVLPSNLSGGSTSDKAQLVLTAEHNDPITIERGDSGTLRDLDNLGFREITEAGVIKGPGIANPGTAWGIGDITINDVVIDASGTDSLQGKLDAINSVVSETGVNATAFASGMIDMENFNFTQWATISAFPDFLLNGVTLTGIMAATSIEEMVTIFNDQTNSTGITAKQLGKQILLEGEKAIVFSNPTTSNTGDAFGFSNYGNADFLSSVNDVSAAGSIDFVTGTLAEAGIKLASNNGDAIRLSLDDPPAGTTGFVNFNASIDGNVGSSLTSVNIRTQSSAQKAIGVVDNALETIYQVRSDLGAANNRLEFTIFNLANITEKTLGARSRIMDSDFANETARLSRSQVLQQASTAMLAQANARPNQILSLLN